MKFKTEDDLDLLLVACPNCHTPISKGDIYCSQCNKLLVRQIIGGEE